MHLSNTIVALRKGGETVIGWAGVRTTRSGIILRHRSNLLTRVYSGQALFACNTTEGLTAMIVEQLSEEMMRSNGDPKSAALALCRTMAENLTIREANAEGIFATKDFLALLSSTGAMLEPEEGFVAIGSSAPIASGAIKALVIHSKLSTEQIVRESLRISGQLNPFGHEEMSVERV